MLLLNLEGSFHFAAVEDLERTVREVMERQVRVIVLRMRRLHLLGSTGVSALKNIFEDASRAGITVLVCGITEEVSQTLEAAGLETPAGSDPAFPACEALFESTRQALDVANSIATAGDS